MISLRSVAAFFSKANFEIPLRDLSAGLNLLTKDFIPAFTEIEHALFVHSVPIRV